MASQAAKLQIVLNDMVKRGELKKEKDRSRWRYFLPENEAPAAE